MVERPKENYDQMRQKLRKVWEEADRLIAEHNQILEKLTYLEDKIRLLQSSVNSIYEGTRDV